LLVDSSLGPEVRRILPLVIKAAAVVLVAFRVIPRSFRAVATLVGPSFVAATVAEHKASEAAMVSRPIDIAVEHTLKSGWIRVG